MNARERWRRLAVGDAGTPPLIDIGASTLTGVRLSAAPRYRRARRLASPIMGTVPLSAADSRRLGSDCARAGFVFDAPAVVDDQFTDALSVGWLCVDGAPSPLSHPLQAAGLADIARHPRPEWPNRVQFPRCDGADLIVVADAPCPGLLDMCFGLRDRWRFMDDIASDWRAASALLDWSLETIVLAYERMLGALPRPPDIVVYADDYGWQGGMFISDLDFRTFVRPRLRTLLSRLRRLTPAAICLHSCGAIRPIIPDLAGLGVDLLNFDGAAKGMSVSELRRDLPGTVIFHGSVDLVALGRAVEAGDFAALARLTTELADSTPVIAAPADCIASPEDLAAAALGATFVKHLSEEDFVRLRRLGPVKEVIERARRATPLPGGEEGKHEFSLQS